MPYRELQKEEEEKNTEVTKKIGKFKIEREINMEDFNIKKKKKLYKITKIQFIKHKIKSKKKNTLKMPFFLKYT